MRLGDLKLRKEGLSRFPFPPVIAVEHLCGIMGEIVVCLAFTDGFSAAFGSGRGRIRNKPTRVAKQAWEMPVRWRQRLWILHVVGMQSCRGLVAPENECRTGSTAHGGSGISACVAAALRSEAVQMRSVDLTHAVSGCVGRHVIGDNPNKVGGPSGANPCAKSKGQYREAFQDETRRSGGAHGSVLRVKKVQESFASGVKVESIHANPHTDARGWVGHSSLLQSAWLALPFRRPVMRALPCFKPIIPQDQAILMRTSAPPYPCTPSLPC